MHRFEEAELAIDDLSSMLQTDKWKGKDNAFAPPPLSWKGCNSRGKTFNVLNCFVISGITVVEEEEGKAVDGEAVDGSIGSIDIDEKPVDDARASASEWGEWEARVAKKRSELAFLKRKLGNVFV